MKIFFTASQRGKKEFDKHFHEIYDAIKAEGLEHLDERLLKSTPESLYEKMEKEGKKAYMELFNNNIKMIQSADICAFECSSQSFSIGYMIQKSLELNKPTIAYYLEGYTPYFLVGSDEDKLIVKSYNEKNIKKVVAESLEEARNLSDKRFNFFVSPSILVYLNEESRKQGITKSAFIRNLLLEHKRKHGDLVK